MRDLTVLCRNVTTFSANGDLDEEAFRSFLDRFVEHRLGVYLGSGGSGEGHALSHDELRRVYAIGVEHGRGRIPVCANPPEQHTAAATRHQTMLAVQAGVDIVNIYGPASWHGFRPTDDELKAYFDEVVTGIDHPLAIAPNPVIGYTPSPRVVAEICDRHRQIRAVNLAGTGDAYFIQLKDALRPDVDVYVPLTASLETLHLGATGLLGAEANILPATFRAYIDHYAAGDWPALATDYAEIRKFTQFTARWHSASPRWLKMAMKVLKLPGGDGGPRPPYRPAPPEEVETFAKGLFALGIREIEARRERV